MDPAQAPAQTKVVQKVTNLKNNILSIAADWQKELSLFATLLSTQLAAFGTGHLDRQAVVSAIVVAAQRWFIANTRSRVG